MSTDDDCPTASVNDAVVVGTIPQQLLSRRISVAFGKHREDKEWRNTECSLGELVGGQLTKFLRGDSKDGMCMLQGAVVEPADASKRGVPRTWKNMRESHLLLVDYDTGVPLEKIVSAIAERGLFAVLWTTWSHQKGRTEIPQDAIAQFMRGKGLGGVVPMEKDILAYLREDRLVHESVLAGFQFQGAQHVEGGVKYVVSHNPCPRVRALFVLEKAFIFAERGATQEVAKNEWKGRYAGFCESLGLPHDNACCDPSRLMYVPNIPFDAEVGEGKHEIIVLAGKALDLDAVVITSQERGSRSRSGEPIDANVGRALAAHGIKVDGVAGAGGYVTKNLVEFAKRAGHDFLISSWLRDNCHDVRHEYPDGVDAACPNVDAHSVGDDKDRAFRVWDGSGERTGRGFGASCRHATCQNASGDDRLWFLDRLCAMYGVADALDLITEDWCPTVKAEQARHDEVRAAEAAEAADSYHVIDDRIATLTSGSTEKDIGEVIVLLARRPVEERIAVSRRLDRLSEQTGTRKKDIEAELTAVRKREAPRQSSFDATVERVLRQLYEKNNPPALFLRANNHKAVRVNGAPGKRWLEEMSLGVWKAELNRRVPLPVPHDNETVVCIANRTELEFPVVRRVATVPVFGKDGTLRATEGYDPMTQEYVSIDRDLRLPEIPATVTKEDVAEARWWLLAEALRDVPFSDCFEGGDNTPIYDAQKDDAGYPLPNFERGLGSRANFMAMVLQPFVRSMIDGPVPAYHVSKTTHAEGGTLITHMPGVIATGQHMPTQGKPDDGDEFQKLMLSTLLESPPYVLFDNLKGAVDNGVLAMAITSRVYGGRELGFTRNAKVEVVGSFVYTGVGIHFSKELHRRNVPIRLDANMDDPSKRTFKYDFDEFLTANRGQLIWACLVLIKNWVQQGMPPSDAKMASFDKWAGIMGGILDTAGIGGFLSNMKDYQEHGLEARTHDTALVEALIRTFGTGRFTATEAIERLLMNPDTASALDPVGMQPGGRDGDASQTNKRRLARYLNETITGRVHLITDLKAITKLALPSDHPSVSKDETHQPQVRVVCRQPAKKSPIQWQFSPSAGNPTEVGIGEGSVLGLSA